MITLSVAPRNGIPNANPHKVGLTAVRIGIVAFVVPYMFAYALTLLMQGDAISVAIDVLGALLGTHLIAVGVQGYSVLRRLVRASDCSHWGLLLIKPGLVSDAAGVLAGASIVMLARLRVAKTVAAASTEPTA